MDGTTAADYSRYQLSFQRFNGCMNLLRITVSETGEYGFALNKTVESGAFNLAVVRPDNTVSLLAGQGGPMTATLPAGSSRLVLYGNGAGSLEVALADSSRAVQLSVYEEPPTSMAFVKPFARYNEVSAMMSEEHPGTDFAMDEGEEIFAAADGVVKSSVYQEIYGNCVVLYHGKDAEGRTVSTMYSQLQDRLVSEGETVKAGQVIGYAGTTGNSTGPHLHLELLVEDMPRDPLSCIPY